MNKKSSSSSSLSRKPAKAQEAKDVSNFINKGLDTPAAKKESNDSAISRLQLRLPKSKVQQIDEALEKKRVKVSRHHWILEAIEEKLEREGSI